MPVSAIDVCRVASSTSYVFRPENMVLLPSFFLIKAASWSNEIRWNPASLKSIKQEGGWSVGNDVQMLSLLWIFLRGRKARMCGCVDVCVLQDVTPAWLKRFAYIGKRCAERLLGNRADWSKTEGCYIALVTLQHGWKLLGMASK